MQAEGPSAAPRPSRAQRIWISIAIVATFAFAGTAVAGTSLVLGATFPGWDRIRTGGLEEAASDLEKDYAREVGHSCSRTEVLLRGQSGSIITGLVFYEGFLPFGSNEQVLLNTADQRVAIITKSNSFSDVLSVMVRIDGGIVLVLC